MRGSRKFCQRGSNFGQVFLVDEGISGAIISRPAKHHSFKWRFTGVNDDPTLNARLVAL